MLRQAQQTEKVSSRATRDNCFSLPFGWGACRI